MFVRRNGTYECALSGGCLEPTVAEAAARVIATGDPVIVSYDLAEDSIWGLGIGCSGAVDIRIERIGDDAITNDWLTILERGEAAVLVTPLSGVSGRMIVRGTGGIVGGLTDPIVEQRAVASARARLGAPYPASGPERLGGADVFYEITLPPPDLVIFGAGHDAAPVAQLAWTLGFAVAVVDVRETFLTKERFGSATRVCAHFSQFAERVALGPGSFALIMNHHVERTRRVFGSASNRMRPTSACSGPGHATTSCWQAWRSRRYVPDPMRAARCEARWDSPWGLRHQKKWRLSILGELLAIRRGFERRVSQRLHRQPSPPGGQPALGQLVVLGRVDIHQQIRRKPQDRGPLEVALQNGTRAVLEPGELGEELTLEQMRRRHDLAVHRTLTMGGACWR